MTETIKSSDAGMGGVPREIDTLRPEEIERMQRLHGDARPAGTMALSTEYTFIGIEGTGETTVEDRKKLAEEGISSYPIGWGVVFSRRHN